MAKKTKKNKETEQNTQAQTPSGKMSVEQEINALKAAHNFFSNFDRVPGSLANSWSQALDAVAVVANSLIAKYQESLQTTSTPPKDEKQPAVQ